MTKKENVDNYYDLGIKFPRSIFSKEVSYMEKDHVVLLILSTILGLVLAIACIRLKMDVDVLNEKFEILNEQVDELERDSL